MIDGKEVKILLWMRKRRRSCIIVDLGSSQCSKAAGHIGKLQSQNHTAPGRKWPGPCSTLPVEGGTTWTPEQNQATTGLKTAIIHAEEDQDKEKLQWQMEQSCLLESLQSTKQALDNQREEMWRGTVGGKLISADSHLKEAPKKPKRKSSSEEELVDVDHTDSSRWLLSSTVCPLSSPSYSCPTIQNLRALQFQLLLIIGSCA